MYRIDLHERFIESLNSRFTKRSELVNFISESLKIEKEPASRRLSGRVSFSATEIGILAGRLDISLDALLFKPDAKFIVPFQMSYPKAIPSFDSIIETIEKNVIQQQEVSRDSADIKTIFDSLPIELFVTYPELCKFLYFKWGHFFVGSSEFKDYESWYIPPRLDLLNKEVIEYYSNYKSALYIWDYPCIWNLANDIRYLRQIDIINEESVEKIKDDLHQMLHDLECIASGRNSENVKGIIVENAELYVSCINVGVTVASIIGENRSVSFFKNFFVHSYASEDRSYCEHTKSWIEAMKKVSTLISGSGEKERTLFFKEQHRIVEGI